MADQRIVLHRGDREVVLGVCHGWDWRGPMNATLHDELHELLNANEDLPIILCYEHSRQPERDPELRLDVTQ